MVECGVLCLFVCVRCCLFCVCVCVLSLCVWRERVALSFCVYVCARASVLFLLWVFIVCSCVWAFELVFFVFVLFCFSALFSRCGTMVLVCVLCVFVVCVWFVLGSMCSLLLVCCLCCLSPPRVGFVRRLWLLAVCVLFVVCVSSRVLFMWLRRILCMVVVDGLLVVLCVTCGLFVRCCVACLWLHCVV